MDRGKGRANGSNINLFSNSEAGPSSVSLIAPEEDGGAEKILHTREHRFVIAVDYGTTYTGVAYATPSGDDARLDEIDVWDNWGTRMGNHDKIPSVISFSKRYGGAENWGSDLSPGALAMINTKLELDLNDISEELDLITQALAGVDNLNFNYVRQARDGREYTWRRPEDIVKEYLTKVVEHLLIQMQSFSEVVRRELRLDLVITIPAANWSYRAKNSTFRALTQAGFNKENFPRLSQIILITEPEAAALYTARYLRNSNGRDFLKNGDCFLLCDAGGGTVDIVTYLVKRVHPALELELLTIPTTEKCGSVFIDGRFKTWLRQLLGDARFRELDSDSFGRIDGSYKSEGASMRALMQQFIRRKERFRGDGGEIKLTLPHPHGNLNLDGRVVDGQIVISNQTMKEFFDPSIDSIINMVENQLVQADYHGRTVKHICLVGGFGESEYLKSELQRSMEELRDIRFHTPDTSWTAVVRGAVICGIEKGRTRSKVYMEECVRSYGIRVSEEYNEIKHHEPKDEGQNRLNGARMAEDQMLWLVQKGDVILSDEPREVEKTVAMHFSEHDHDTRHGTMKIYASDEDKPPARYRSARHDLEEALKLEYDMMVFSDDELDRKTTPSGSVYFEALLTLRLKLDGRRLVCELSYRDRLLDHKDTQYPA